MNRNSDKNISSKFRGVAWLSARQKWIVCIAINKKSTYIDYFDDEIDAALAYDAFVRKMFGELGTYNFPRPGEQWVVREE